MNRVSNTTRIRKLQVKQDQESLKLDIIAKEQEGINDKMAQLSLSNEKISLRVSEVEEKAGEAIKQAQGSVKKFVCEYASSSDGVTPPETGGQRLHRHGVLDSIYGREQLRRLTILSHTVHQYV